MRKGPQQWEKIFGSMVYFRLLNQKMEAVLSNGRGDGSGAGAAERKNNAPPN